MSRHDILKVVVRWNTGCAWHSGRTIAAIEVNEDEETEGGTGCGEEGARGRGSNLQTGHWIEHCFAFAAAFSPGLALIAPCSFLTCFCFDWCFINPLCVEGKMGVEGCEGGEVRHGRGVGRVD